MRIAMVICAAAALAGCNGVTSKTPWFTKADSAGAPALRTGVWRLTSDQPCDVDESQPLDAWPKCSSGLVVHPDELRGLDDRDGKKVWETMPYILAAGDPPVMQVYSKADADKSTPDYEFAALVPTKSDPSGRAIAIRGWEVVCGPPPSDDKTGGMTKTPFPGLTIDQDGVCTAKSVGALRKAAKLSEPQTALMFEAHWIRDGER